MCQIILRSAPAGHRRSSLMREQRENKIKDIIRVLKLREARALKEHGPPAYTVISLNLSCFCTLESFN